MTTTTSGKTEKDKDGREGESPKVRVECQRGRSKGDDQEEEEEDTGLVMKEQLPKAQCPLCSGPVQSTAGLELRVDKITATKIAPAGSVSAGVGGGGGGGDGDKSPSGSNGDDRSLGCYDITIRMVSPVNGGDEATKTNKSAEFEIGSGVIHLSSSPRGEIDIEED